MEFGLGLRLGFRRANNLELLTRIATTVGVTLCARMKSLTAFLELERVTRHDRN
jgi:hypothetical protein